MEIERDLFVQAFWVKCREVIRPEIDLAAARLGKAGYRTDVSSQEYQPPGAAADGSGPSLTLTVDGAVKDGPVSALRFTGDAGRQKIVVTNSGSDSKKPQGSLVIWEMSQVDAVTVKALIDGLI